MAEMRHDTSTAVLSKAETVCRYFVAEYAPLSSRRIPTPQPSSPVVALLEEITSSPDVSSLILMGVQALQRPSQPNVQLLLEAIHPAGI